MKVIIALSGGVDSAVAAFLLKKQNYEVIGVHMQNWDVELNEGLIRSEKGCSGKRDLEDVKRICDTLNIPLHVYTFVPEYWEKVFIPYIDSLEENLNTNPDIFCNYHIKFGVLFDKVVEDFGKDIKLATGHWAKIIQENNRYYLGVCSNKFKDQTYFLSALTEQKLSKVIFPLAEFTSKEEIREIAKQIGIFTWDKKDSVGICFIGKRNYRDFLSNYIEEKEGNLVDIETNEILGKHRGTHLYVLHQREGLFLKGYEEKYYVCGKDVEKNIVYLCRKSAIPKYLHKSLTRCKKLHWINKDKKLNIGDDVYVKARHSPKFFKARILEIDDFECLMEHEKMYVTSPGQAIVFYEMGDSIKCLGMGIYFDHK
ncbi:tRNA 2-thiouridine(34) synthase MnmA [Candidatus Mycoplasma haematohominis]|uniref:tRNA-specific 2-thiouridylase MnmA n=1 Tax=Candidatus Mycoplasma haematohominis TaxID=1494318 RepID=A0A478FPG1_9MOLU|nr:tRNA 2-thiouridine(34) synthase MnmA [Candidatus Mycoplasma haemohominis]GCE63288.1 tRNA-specific 2-thiouridylase MnmA [Candidatus Mycoplasma haemohominis]